MIQVRRATADDVPWLVSQLRDFSEFFGTKRPLFDDPAFATRGITAMVMDHLVFVAFQDDIPVGFIAGYVTPHPFNPSIRSLIETFWWVDEAHRGSRAGLSLLNTFVAWGRANADWVMCSLEARSPVKDDVLLKRGFRLQERNFLLEVV